MTTRGWPKPHARCILRTLTNFRRCARFRSRQMRRDLAFVKILMGRLMETPTLWRNWTILRVVSLEISTWKTSAMRIKSLSTSKLAAKSIRMQTRRRRSGTTTRSKTAKLKASLTATSPAEASWRGPTSRTSETRTATWTVSSNSQTS